MPAYGVQLETHSGVRLGFLPTVTLFKRRHFIPISIIRDVVINEALHRWNVRYYLSIISDTGEDITMDSVFGVSSILNPF